MINVQLEVIDDEMRSTNAVSGLLIVQDYDRRTPPIERVVEVTRHAGQQSAVSLDLSAGEWLVEIKTPYYGSLTALMSLPHLTAGILYLHIGQNRAKINSNPESKNLRVKSKIDRHLLPRSDALRFTPSRADISVPGLKQFSSNLSPHFEVTLCVTKAGSNEPLKQRARFLDLKSENERIAYWLTGQEEVLSDAGSIIHSEPEILDNRIIYSFKLSLEGLPHLKNATTYLKIRFSEQLYVVMLPLPWGKSINRIKGKADLQIEFLLPGQLPSGESLFLGTKLFMPDPIFNSVTQFLSNGDIPSSMEIWKSYAKDLLFNKYQNPMAAAAAVLVLVGAAQMGLKDSNNNEADWTDWHQWARNLANDFPQLAEGKIGLTWLDALWGSSEKDGLDVKTRAKECFSDSIKNRIPIFKEAIRLQLRGCEWAFDNCDSDDDLRAVRWLAEHTQSNSAITTVRYDHVSVA